MSNRAEKAPPVRRSFLIVAGIAIGAVLIAVVLINFVFTGDSEEATPTTSPGIVSTQPGTAGQTGTVTTPTQSKPQKPYELRPGGKDPFKPI